MDLLILYLIFLIIPIYLSSLCIDGNFSLILPNIENSFEIGPKNEKCYQYQITKSKNKISLVFPNIDIATTEVIIYKSKTEIILNGNSYKNMYDRYYVIENYFKEIDLTDFDENIYIIIRDIKYSKLYINKLILYDTQFQIPLIEGKPLTMKYFISNNIYKFEYFSNKNLTFIYSTKIKQKKYISITYNNETIIENQIDTTDKIFNLKSEDLTKKFIYIYIEEIEKGIESQEFSVVVYEKGINQFFEIEKNDIININYINLNEGDEIQTFFFYYKLNESIKANTINFKLDPFAYKTQYINILSGFYHSEKELKNEEVEKYFLFEENKFPIEYDLNSEEYKKIYFQDSDISFPYRYIYFKIEISKLENYYSPKNMIISIGEEVKEINLKDIKFYKTEIIKKEIKPYIPTYFKLILSPEQRYIFYSPYPNNTIYLKGDLIISDDENKIIKINKYYFIDKDEIFVIKDLSEFTVAIFGSEKFEVNFYIEKFLEKDLYISEYIRNDEPIDIKFEENDCSLNKQKYLIGIYDKEIYSKNKNKKTYRRYWTSIDGEMKVYYRNNISLEGESLFPFSEKYNKEKENIIVIFNYIDFFTFKCSKPGTLSLRSEYKLFNEKTHIISQNSIKIINITKNIEIIQFSSTITPPSDYLYFAIFSKFGKKIKISPDIPYLFNETIIEGDIAFTQKIDLYKFKPDQLVVKVNSTENTQIEVIEIIRYNFTEYTIIKNNKINHLTDNNFVKFINKNTTKLKVIIKGLNNVYIHYGLVKLFTDDVNYLPMGSQFGDLFLRKKAEYNETIEIYNHFYENDNDNKKYLAFIFSIQFYQYYEYDAQVIDEDINQKENNKDEKEINNKNNTNFIFIIIIGIIIISLIINISVVFYFIFIKKNKCKKKFEMDIEKIDKEPIDEENNYIGINGD